jgi:hypothetical protein
MTPARPAPLPGHYPASALPRAAPTPNGPAHAVIDSPAASGLPTPARWISQVPRPVCRCAPPAPTPAGRPGACTGCFPVHAGFSFSGSLATCDLCFEAALGSTYDGLRLTALLSAACAASPGSLSEPALLPVFRCLRTTDRSDIYNQQFTWQPPFRLRDRPGFAWRTRGHRVLKNENGARRRNSAATRGPTIHGLDSGIPAGMTGTWAARRASG